jgi:hypothetical protein
MACRRSLAPSKNGSLPMRPTTAARCPGRCSAGSSLRAGQLQAHTSRRASFRRRSARSCRRVQAVNATPRLGTCDGRSLSSWGDGVEAGLGQACGSPCVGAGPGAAGRWCSRCCGAARGDLGSRKYLETGSHGGSSALGHLLAQRLGQAGRTTFSPPRPVPRRTASALWLPPG